MHSAGVCDIECRHGGEEDIIEVGHFEREVNEGVEEVPTEEDADLGSRWCAEKDEGGAVGSCEESCDGGEGEDARVVE